MERDELLLLSDLNLAEALRESARSSGGSILEGEGYLLTAGPGAHPMLNNALRLDPSLDASAFMQRTRRFYGERGHGYSLTLREHVADADLAKAAQEAGLSPTLEPPAMVVQHRLEDVAPPDVSSTPEGSATSGTSPQRHGAATVSRPRSPPRCSRAKNFCYFRTPSP